MSEPLWVVLLTAALAFTTGCGAPPEQAPLAASGEEAVLTDVPKPVSLVPFGRWKSDELCLSLFANGDFEVSMQRPRGPKQLVMGRAEAQPAEHGGIALKLSVTRIWKGRYMGACRKVHQTGGWMESIDILGINAVPGADAELTLNQKSDSELELCGSRCVTLTRDEPHLGATWRKVGLNSPRQPATPYRSGELLELKLANASSHLWLATGSADFSPVYGEATVRSLGGDRFEVVFNGGKSESSRTLTATRLSEHRLDVCEGTEPCATLERQFDGYAYSVE